MSDATTPKSDDLRVADIIVRDRLRPVSEAGVESLLASIRDIGIIKDEIHVRLARRAGRVELRLLAGGHRLEAARRLGWETIRAKVWRDITDEMARLIEVDDNLAGAEMNALDTAVFLAERKRVYEDLHPETRAGVFKGNQHTGKVAADMMSVTTFAVATAEKFGLTERHVRRMISAGMMLTASDLIRLRRAPRPVTQADLQIIAKIDTAGDRIAVVEALADGTVRSAREALARLRAEPASVAGAPDPADQEYLALRTAWSRAGAPARRRWISEAFDELSPLVVDRAEERDEAEIIDLRAHLANGGGA